MSKGKKTLVGRETKESVKESVVGRKYGKRLVDEAKRQGLDPVADFENPVKREPEQTALIESPLPPSVVRGKKILANYVRPHYLLSEDQRVIELEFSFALTDEHKKVIPPIVRREWEHLSSNSSQKIMGIQIEPQTIELFMAPDMEPELHLTGVSVVKAALALIEESGSGAVKKITRFSFRAVVPADETTYWPFVNGQYGQEVWLSIEQTQGSLL